MLLLLEPVLNPVWTWLLRGEHPGRWTIIGGAIILTATALRNVRDRRVPPRLVTVEDGVPGAPRPPAS